MIARARHWSQVGEAGAVSLAWIMYAVYNVAGRLPFLGVVDTVATLVSAHAFRERPDLAEVLDVEVWARAHAHELVEEAGQR